MTKHTPVTPEQPEEQETFTKEDVLKIIQQERKNQFLADETRIHGNAFFAEALDHIATLGARDPFWKKVYGTGMMFKQQFEINTGQVAVAPQQKPAPAAAPAAKKEPEKPADAPTADDASSYESQG